MPHAARERSAHWGLAISLTLPFTDKETGSERVPDLPKTSQHNKVGGGTCTDQCYIPGSFPSVHLLLHGPKDPTLLFLSTLHSCGAGQKSRKSGQAAEKPRQEARHSSLHLTCCVTLHKSQPFSEPQLICTYSEVCKFNSEHSLYF